jgi:hypothetical protein
MVSSSFICDCWNVHLNLFTYIKNCNAISESILILHNSISCNHCNSPINWMCQWVYRARSEVLATVLLKIHLLCSVALCCWVSSSWGFKGSTVQEEQEHHSIISQKNWIFDSTENLHLQQVYRPPPNTRGSPSQWIITTTARKLPSSATWHHAVW